METSSIVIFGLGRVGTEFLEHFLQHADLGVSIIGVVEPKDTPGRRKAQEAGIALLTADQVVDFGEDVDFIFDFTGTDSFRPEITRRLAESGNHHTEVSSEKTLRMMWRLMTDQPLPIRI